MSVCVSLYSITFFAGAACIFLYEPCSVWNRSSPVQHGEVFSVEVEAFSVEVERARCSANTVVEPDTDTDEGSKLDSSEDRQLFAASPRRQADARLLSRTIKSSNSQPQMDNFFKRENR